MTGTQLCVLLFSFSAFGASVATQKGLGTLSCNLKLEIETAESLC